MCRNKHKSVPKSAQECAGISTKTSRKRHTQKKDINTKENINKTIVGKPDESAIQVLDFLNSKTGKRFKPTKTNLGFINARIKDGFSINDLKIVVDRKASEWLNDPHMNQYLRPSTLFNSEKCDGYLNTTTALATQNQRIEPNFSQKPTAKDNRQAVHDSLNNIHDIDW